MVDSLMRDASEVGQHCSVCKALDFLPFQCNLCQLVFCRDHSANARPDQHHCQGASTQSSDVVFDKDGKPIAASSDTVSVSFKSLLPERSRDSAVAPAAEQLEKERKKQDALALLHTNFPQTSTSTAPSTKPVNKPVNKKVALIKLKQKAKPADPRKTEKQILAADRRYLTVRNQESGKMAEVWLPKDCTCGRALDLLAKALGVPNNNHLPSTPASRLIHLVKTEETSSEPVFLPTSSTLGSVTSDADELFIQTGS